MTVIALSNEIDSCKEAFEWGMKQFKNNSELFFVQKSENRKIGGSNHSYIVCRHIRPDDGMKFFPLDDYTLVIGNDMRMLDINEMKMIVREKTKSPI